MTFSKSSHKIVIDASVLPRQQESLQRRAMQVTTLSATSLRSHQQQQYIRDLYEFKVERNNGLPVSLSCTDSVSASNDSSNSTTAIKKVNDTRQVLDTTILFDYEITLRDPMEEIVEVLFQDLPKWEFFLLYYVAEDIGIIGCQNIGMQNITSSSRHNSTSVEVINLSSIGSDVVDTRVASCEFLVDLEPGYICLPLKGTMTAVFVGYESDRPAVESFLAYHVAAVVNNSDFIGADVNRTAFIGSRVIPSPAPIVDSTIDETKSIDTDNSTVDVTVAVASTLSVAAVFFMFLIYFVVARRGPRRSPNSNADVTDIPLSDITSKQVPTGGADDVSCETMRQPQQVNTNPTQSSIDSTSEKSDDARCGSLESANRLGREVIASSIQTPYSLINTRTVSTVVSTDDSDIYIEDDETAKVSNINENVDMNTVVTTSNETQIAMTVALPPKHPTGPSSKALLVPLVAVAKPPKSQRRRKKKKKKVATIIRSNSRENIKEMETITEVEEETSGDNNDLHDASDDDEDGSWCSTSDSDPGSRDPSPARSSRDPSPARSTGSAGKDRAATSAVADTTMWNTTTSIGPSPDRTMGTDKPKPKKIPPTWV